MSTAVVVLHYPSPGRGASGIARYARQLRDALRVLGEPVREWPQRNLELRVGRRKIGGLVTQRIQMAWRPPRRHGLLHSAHAYSAHPRADVATVQDCFPEVYKAELGRTSMEEAHWARLLARLVRRGTHWITSTATVRSTFLQLHPEVDASLVHVTPYGVDPSFRPPTPYAPRDPRFQADRFNVLSVADLNPRKRLDWLLTAVQDMEEVRVVHAGSQNVHRPAWQLQADRERALEDRLAGRFLRTGPVLDHELLRLYQGADLLVMTSLDEGFGLPPLEALACGTPVLALDRPVFREVLQDQADYYQTPDQLPEALRSLATRTPTRKQREARHAWVRAHYTWEKTARLTQTVYSRSQARA